MFTRIHPIGVLWTATTAFVVGTSVLYPPLFDAVQTTETEGPAEQVSHAIILASAVAWLLVAGQLRREPGPRRTAAVALAAYTSLLFVEEIDWGLIYGFPWIARGFEAVIGIPSLHHTQWENWTMFVDKLFWFAVPAMLWFTLPQWGPRAVRAWFERLAPLTPTRAETRWFWISASTYIAMDLLFGVRTMDLYQLLVYALFGVAALRARRALVAASG